MLLRKDVDPQGSTKSKKSKRGLSEMLREASNKEDIPIHTAPGVSEDPDRPWSLHFHAYLNAPEQVPEGWSANKWWGVSIHALFLAFKNTS
jgi:hypothetical protein